MMSENKPYPCYKGDNYFPPNPDAVRFAINSTGPVNFAGGTLISIPDFSTGLKMNYCFKNKFIIESGIMLMRRNYYFKKNIDTIIKYTPPFSSGNIKRQNLRRYVMSCLERGGTTMG